MYMLTFVDSTHTYIDMYISLSLVNLILPNVHVGQLIALSTKNLIH